MNTQTELKPVVVISEAERIENPMQERNCREIAESVEVSAEAVFAARKHEDRGEAGPIFVP
jgi:hypothetical protein